MITHDEKLKMCKSMKVYGGSFASALAECFILADSENLERLYKAFPELVLKHTTMFKWMDEDDSESNNEN